MRRMSFVFLLIIFLVPAAQAFDGERRGFVLSLGMGYSPYAHHTQTHHGETFAETASGGAGSFDLGWGWDEHNVLLFGANVTVFDSGLFGDRRATQGFAGFSWNHYFGPMGNSVFTTIGLGTYAFSLRFGYEQPESYWDESTDEYVYQAASPRRRGVGALLGVGYEFVKHLQAGVFVSAGRTTAFEVDIEHVQVSFLVQGVAF